MKHLPASVLALAAKQLPPFLGAVPEFRFAPPRRWRFDWAWPEFKVALEVEGGAWTGGRHTRGKGFLNDMEKYNEAVCLGWRIIRVVPNDLHAEKTRRMLLRLTKTTTHYET